MAAKAPPAPDNQVSIAKIAMPFTVVVSVILAVASFVYSAGNKVGGSEKDIAYLTSKVDALQMQIKDQVIARLESDHDAVIRLDQRVASLEAAEAGKDIRISMDDGKPKTGGAK